MFSKHYGTVLADLSADLRNEADWNVGSLRKFIFPLNITALAVEPIAGLLAAGTANGSVYIFGASSVESEISLPESVGVRFLHFSISTYFLLCHDDNNQLFIYNLLEFGRPKLVTSARFDQTNSLTLSPSHTHVFFALQNGDVKTYDLTCLRKSPYTIPNLWKLYEQDSAAKGVPNLASPAPQNSVETVIHPRDLNQLFVAYAGGIILTDLTERNTHRAYELILRPGAPGGAGYRMNDILAQRRMVVTSIAVHPTGHFFAVGYADGSIAFWATEDDEKPLVVRTIDDTDVDIANPEKLQTPATDTSSSPLREPIFKLSWSGFPNSSDPRGGETVLTMLGGLTTGKQPGLTVFVLPEFNPPEPLAGASALQGGLHPAFRQTMCHAVVPKKIFFYETRGVVQDYLLIPRGTPHFGGTFNPYAILFVIDRESARTVEAAEFPPPDFVSTLPQESQKAQEAQAEESLNEGVTFPKSPEQRSRSPMPLTLPFLLSNCVRGGCLFTLETDVYETFVSQKSPDDTDLDLKGGEAFSDPARLNELKLSKYQPRRILVTYNCDQTIRFFDLSTTLLIPPANAPLQHSWPKPLVSLTIWLDLLLKDTNFSEKLSVSPDVVSIQSVQIAATALEAGIALNSGEVIIYRNSSVPSKPAASLSPSKEAADEKIVLIEQSCSRRTSKLKPYFMMRAEKSQVETFALSDIGFLSVAYRDGSLAVIDMRGPNTILLSERRQNKRKSYVHVPGSPSDSGSDIIKCLKWTVCPLDKEPCLRVRLIAIPQSGNAEIYTLICSGNPTTWNVFSDIVFFKAAADPLPDCTFVLDAISGAPSRAEPSKLAMVFKNEKIAVNDGPRCLLVSVGRKGVRVNADVNGEKLSKMDLGTKFGSIMCAQVIAHSGSHALVVHTEKNDVLAYTLPYLELIWTVQLPDIPYLPLTIDESGDYLAWTTSSDAQLDKRKSTLCIEGATYGTLFNFRRAYPLPDIDLASTRGSIPSQPQPVSLGPASFLSGLGSWLPLRQTMSGKAIDDLLGGPDRPIPEKIALEKARLAEEDVQSSAGGLAASAAAVQTNLYNKLTSAIGERGQLLGDLEERFNSLEAGSRDMVSQAKRLAAQQTAKSWFGF